jgi:dTDP-4-amino-4,6-dideoxygalactose transaminase
MSARYQSLYFASIDFRRAGLLLLAWLLAPLTSRAARRRALASAVREHVGDAEVYAFASGRGALAACLKAAGIGPGDSVLLSSFTCLAVPAAVLAVGARPEYVDIDSSTLATLPEAVSAAFHSGVRALVVQHTLGRSAQTEALLAAAATRGILAIEDCALALGSRRAGRPLGTSADAAFFSMELSKTLSTGWGGILTVRDAALARQVDADYASVPEPRPFDTARRVLQTAICGVCFQPMVFPVGRYIVAALFRLGLFRPSTPATEIAGRPGVRFVERLSGTQAVLAAAQWRRLPQVAAMCSSYARRLHDALRRAGFEVLATPEAQDEAVTPRVAFLVSDRATTTRWFASHDVELGCWFDGPLSPPPGSDAYNYDHGRYPVAARIAAHVVNLPSHCRLSEADIARLISLIEEYAHEQGESAT